MWPFDNLGDISKDVIVNVTDVRLNSLLNLFSVQDDGISPFSELPNDINLESLPSNVPTNKQSYLAFDVTMSLIETKEKLSFWKCNILFQTEVKDEEWTTFVIVNSSKKSSIKSEIKKFLDDKRPLSCYIKDTLVHNITLSQMIRMVIDENQSAPTETLEYIPF